MNLENYGISRKTGFLWDIGQFKQARRDEFNIIHQAALSLPDALPSGRIRSYLGSVLPHSVPKEALSSCSEDEARMTIRDYLFLAQAYVWGEQVKVATLPAFLAIPICSLARRLQQPPILTYRNYVLDNWSYLESDGDVVLENIKIPLQFLGGQDEHWFIAIHVAVEAAAAAAVSLAIPLIDACKKKGKLDEVLLLLNNLGAILAKVNRIFGRVIERCDPFIYYKRVRPFIHGWKDNPNLPAGLIYDGVDEFRGEPQKFRGETGAQSAMVPIFDALLGVKHAENDDLRTYLDDLHNYRPSGHRSFVDFISAHSTVRSSVMGTRDGQLTESYNLCVSEVVAFRAQHLEFARTYVFDQIERNSAGAPKVGTGGTPFIRYLEKHHQETQRNLL